MVRSRNRPQGCVRGRYADRKKTCEDNLRDEESLYRAAQEFARLATEILTKTAKGVFNILSCGWCNNRAGRDESKVMEA